jgi:hypothetical protein
MLGLKATTEENLLREIEQNMFDISIKPQQFHVVYTTTRHTALFLYP